MKGPNPTKMSFASFDQAFNNKAYRADDLENMELRRLKKDNPSFAAKLKEPAESIALLTSRHDGDVGAAVLIDTNIAIVPLHCLQEDKSLWNFRLEFGRSDFQIASVLEWDAKLDYAVVQLKQDKHGNNAGELFETATLTKDQVNDETVLLHYNNGELVVSTGNSDIGDQDVLHQFASSKTQDGSCGGANFVKSDGEYHAYAIHLASATGKYGGQKGESKGLLIRDIVERSPNGLVAQILEANNDSSDEYRLRDSDFESDGDDFRYDPNYLSQRVASDDCYDLETKKGLSRDKLRESGLFNEHFLNKHTAQTKSQAIKQINNSRDPRYRMGTVHVVRISTENVLNAVKKELLKEDRFTPSRIWVFKDGKYKGELAAGVRLKIHKDIKGLIDHCVSESTAPSTTGSGSSSKPKKPSIKL